MLVFARLQIAGVVSGQSYLVLLREDVETIALIQGLIWDFE